MDKLVRPRRGLSSAEWQAEAFRLMALVARDRDVANAMLAELLTSDPATWLEPLSRNPAVQTAAMIQRLALAARPPRTTSSADPDQMLAVAEALASITPDQFGKISALQDLWISRGLVCRERGLHALFESARDSDEEEGQEERLALLWKIVGAIKASD
jgi:hypothetical protein